MSAPLRFRLRHGGFSLVEVMVGLLIGMLTVVVMMQVFSVSEGYKRSTTGGSDAQNNGAIALNLLQREIAQSGHALSSFQLIGCNVQVGTWTVNALAPVTINHASIPAGDAGSDTLLVAYSNANGPPEGETIQAQPSQSVYTVSSFTAPASGTSTYAVGDRVIAEPQIRPSPCNLRLDTVASTTAPSNVTVATGVLGMTSGTLFNLGAAPRIAVYRVRAGNLTVCDYMANDCSLSSNANSATVWVPLASNIVSLRAQYGRDSNTPMDAVVDIYNRTTPSTQCNWAKISAVRVALVARSATLEKANVIGTGTNVPAPTWAGTTANPTGSEALPIDLSAANSSTWQRYRYKVFETTIPQRNMAWMGVQSGC